MLLLIKDTCLLVEQEDLSFTQQEDISQFRINFVPISVIVNQFRTNVVPNSYELRTDFVHVCQTSYQIHTKPRLQHGIYGFH